MLACLVCGKKCRRSSYKYCSNQCQADFRYNEYVEKWKKGLVSGERGISTKSISNHIKRYLFEKYGRKCSECGWHKTNPYSKLSPLEIDHINGSSDDNSELNLRLLCPNCHSLSKNYKNLNKGSGRAWRMLKYVRN